MRIYEHLLASRPDHPAPYFLKVATYQSWMSTFRTNRYQSELEENLRLAVEKGEKLLAERDDPWVHFYIGSSYGYQALNHFRKSSWFNAYLEALKGVHHLEAALEREPRLYDAYLGLGTYDYWRTAKSRFLRTIAFWMEDRRESAIAKLEFVVEHGLYAAREATYSLIVTYWDSGRYDKALQLVERNLRRKDFPNVTDLYYKARLLARFKQWPEVESLFRKVLKRLQRSGVASVAYQVECEYWIARALFEQGFTEAAVPFLESAFHQTRNMNESGELEGYFESRAEIQDLLLSLNDKVKQAGLRASPGF
jgi:tetratricopeptide (TPR) repeat protein